MLSKNHKLLWPEDFPIVENLKLQIFTNHWLLPKTFNKNLLTEILLHNINDYMFFPCIFKDASILLSLDYVSHSAYKSLWTSY